MYVSFLVPLFINRLLDKPSLNRFKLVKIDGVQLVLGFDNFYFITV